MITAALLGVLIQASSAASPPAVVAEGYFPGSGGTKLFHRKVGTGPKLVVFLHGGPGSNFRGSGDVIERLGLLFRLVVETSRRHQHVRMKPRQERWQSIGQELNCEEAV